MSSVVLDASALLAVMHGERGADRVVPKLRESVISSVNYSEVLKKLVERGEDLGLAVRNVERVMVVVRDFDSDLARRTAALWPLSKEHGLSLGDRACLALGAALNAEVLTADRRMAKPSLPVKVTVIRGAD